VRPPINRTRFWEAYLLLAGLIVVITAAFAARKAQRQYHRLLDEQRSQAVATVESAAAPVHYPLATGDVDSVRRLVHEMVRERPDIASGLVAGWSGKVVADSETRREGKWVFDLLPPPSGTVARTVYRDHDPAALEVTLPLRFGDTEHGSLRAEVKLAPTRADVVAPTLRFAGIALVLLAVVAVAVGLMTRERYAPRPPPPIPAARRRKPAGERVSPPLPSWDEMGALLEALPLAVLVVDERAKTVRYLNRRFCALWGFPEPRAGALPAELRYEHIAARCHLPVGRAPGEAGHAPPDVVTTDEITLDSGRTIRRLCAGVRDEHGSYVGWMYVFEDVSLRKRTEASLSATRDAAVEAARAKSAFLANMSQELRTPLRQLVETATVLLGTGLDAQQRQYAGSVLASGEALLALTEKIAEFFRVEAGKLEDGDVEIDLSQLIGDVVESLATVAHQKHLELASWVEPDVPSVLLAKGQRLREVLTKLISNALRFTDAGEVFVRASRDAEDGDRVTVRFTVKDTGIGIPPERQQRLFALPPDGSGGLGLLISKQLVESMGGSIGAESQLGHGSTFWFTVPLPRPPARQSQGLPPEDEALRRHRIMVVDDNATSRSVLDRHLESWLIPHEAVASGHDALTRLRAAAEYGAPYSLAILDSQMPEMDGLELARAIRMEPSLAQLPLVLMTAGEPAPPEAARQLGISATLSKPVRPARLRACLAAVLLAT